MHGKNQKTDLVYVYIYLVETFALILNSKIVFQKPFWLKLSILKKIYYVLLLAAGLFKYYDFFHHQTLKG